MFPGYRTQQNGHQLDRSPNQPFQFRDEDHPPYANFEGQQMRLPPPGRYPPEQNSIYNLDTADRGPLSQDWDQDASFSSSSSSRMMDNVPRARRRSRDLSPTTQDQSSDIYPRNHSHYAVPVLPAYVPDNLHNPRTSTSYGPAASKRSPSPATRGSSKKMRIIKACEPCRLRKIGCDGSRPVCHRCQTDNKEGDCRYIQTITRSSLTRKRMTELEDRLELWERIWKGVSGMEDDEMSDGGLDNDRLEKLERSLADRGQEGALLRSKIIENLTGSNHHPVQSETRPPTLSVSVKTGPPNLPNLASPVIVSPNQTAMPRPGNQNTKYLSASPVSSTNWNETRPRAVPDTDGTASIKSGDSGSSYLGLSSGVTFLSVILRLCKERGGIFIDVENSIVLNQQASMEKLRLATDRVAANPGPAQGRFDPALIIEQRTLPPLEVTTPLVDAYFGYFNSIAPIVHEPSMRAVISGELPLPEDDYSLALVYAVLAMGALDSATSESGDHGTEYCEIARHLLGAEFLEHASTELVQTVAILANFLQRSDKPESGYLLLGLAVRMAIAIGLHVAETDTQLTPFVREHRKRVWWSIVLLESGCSKTFGRPSGMCGINLSLIPLPLNVDDVDITAATLQEPPEVWHNTVYSAVIAHSKLACATTTIHTAILHLQPAPSLDQIKQYDKMILQVIRNLPDYMIDASIPVRYNFPRCVLLWRLRDWRAILYRPILLAAAWDQVQENRLAPAIVDAISICRSLAMANLDEIGESARAAHTKELTRAEEWYYMYFAHQSSLTLLLSLVGEPAHPQAEEWRQIILSTAAWFRLLRVMKTPGIALASILENVVFATASIPIMDHTSLATATPQLPFDQTSIDPHLGMGAENESIDVMRYWNALAPGRATGPIWDDSIWTTMLSLNPETAVP